MPTRLLPKAPIGDWLRFALPVLALLGLLVPTYYGLALGLWRYEEHSYAPLLAGLSLALIWYRGRGLTLTPDPGFPILGSLLVVLGALGYVVGRALKTEFIELAACISLLAGTLSVIGGRGALHQMRFPLVFLIFSLPFPAWIVETLTGPMKLGISMGSESLLYALGYPVARNGVSLALGPYRLLVEDACSGLRSLIFLSALGLLYIHLTEPRATWQRVALILSLLPIAVLANFVRVVVLLFITYHFGDAVGQGYWHEVAGLLLFVTAFAGIYSLDSLLSHLGRRHPGPGAPATPAPGVVPAGGQHGTPPSWPRSLALTAVLALTGWLAFTSGPHRLVTDLRPPPDLERLIPDHFGDWRHDRLADALLFKPVIRPTRGNLNDQVLARTYVDPYGQRIMLYISYGSNQLGHEFQEHRPEFCYKGAGFSINDVSEATLPLDAQGLKVRRLATQHHARLESITYWMTIGELATLPGVPRKLEQLRYGLRGLIPDGMLVRVSSVDPNREAAFALQARFIADLGRAVPGYLGFRPLAPASP